MLKLKKKYCTEEHFRGLATYLMWYFLKCHSPSDSLPCQLLNVHTFQNCCQRQHNIYLIVKRKLFQDKWKLAVPV